MQKFLIIVIVLLVEDRQINCTNIQTEHMELNLTINSMRTRKKETLALRVYPGDKERLFNLRKEFNIDVALLFNQLLTCVEQQLTEPEKHPATK